MKQRKVEIFDTSLRDGFQGSRKIAKIQDKIILAQELDNFWVDAIEVGFARSSHDDFRAIQEVSQLVKARVYSLARAVTEDIEVAYDAVKEASKFGVHTFIGTSPSHREKLSKSKDQILEAVRKYVTFTKSLMKEDWVVMFSAEDALRTEREFLLDVVKVASECGADIINIPDTVGYAQPEEIKLVMQQVKASIGSHVKLSVHAHNDYGNASANTLAAIQAGADMAQGTFPPLFWERAGNADLVQVITNLIKRADYFQISLNDRIALEKIYPLITKISEVTWDRIPEKFPIVGRGVYTHGSGIHQDGVNKRSDTYEIISPEEIGLKREQSFFLTNLSGRAGLRNAVDKYFLIKIGESELDAFYAQFIEMTTEKDYIEMQDIYELLVRSGYSIEQNINLHNYDIYISYDKKVIARAIFDGDEYMGEWVGPVDAIFNLVSNRYDPERNIELVDFTIDALGKKTNVQAKVYIKLNIQGVIYEEEAIDDDIVKASLKAFLWGMERILRDKKIWQQFD